jgi:dTDP-4-dehydrorhamnose reductase
MNILITGANGQLGSELQDILASGMADIGAIPATYQTATVFATDTNNLDITDASAVDTFVSQNNIQLIFNCAAYTNVDGCETNPDLAYQVNVVGAANLARAAQSAKATLVHISTDYVFRGDNPQALDENTPCDPQSVYGKTKHQAEIQVAALCSRHFIVRTAWLFGAAGPNFVLTILKLARANGSIKVVNDQHGSPTYAKDLAYTLLKLALTNNYGVYHCANNGSCSWYDLASYAVDKAGIACEKLACSTGEFPRPAPRPSFSILDNARLRATIGNEMRPWQEALDSYLQRISNLH